MSPDDETLEYLRDFDPRTVDEIPAGTPYCLFVDETMEVKGGFTPAVVYENVSGFFPLNYVWGPTFADAERAVEQANERLGIDRARYLEIRSSSFRQAGVQGKLD